MRRLPEHSLPAIVLPIGALLLSMVSVQSGASLAKTLFPIVGAQGTAVLRLSFGAAMLLGALRPWRAVPGTAAWRSITVYGAALGALNLLFYMALRTVPLGIAVALEFTGPLAVAMFSARRLLDFFWLGLAIAGLLLLPAEQSRATLDPAGAAYALAAGAFWALYIVFGQRAGGENGMGTTAWGMLIAAVVVTPFGVVHAGSALFSFAIVPTAIGVGFLSSALPNALEMVALTRLPTRTFGTLMSLEPVFAAFSGLLFLGERLTPVQWLAILSIMAASIGATATIKETVRAPLPD